MFAALADNENAYYGRQLPNLILSPDNPTDSTKSPNQYADTVRVFNPYTKKTETNKGDWASYLRGLDIDQDMKNKAAACRAAKSPEELAGITNYNDKVRCGWIYKAGPKGSPNPEISEGALGTTNGPLSFLQHTSGGQWFWNLMDAQQKIDKARCDCLTNCRDVGMSDFYGKCGFCKGQGRGVPVKPDGSVKYPQNNLLSCAPANLVREVGSCPPPPAPGSPAALAKAQDICSMDANGQVSRNCVLNRLLAAGCSDKGSVAVALQSGAAPDNYARALESVPAFQKYQLFATTPLNSDVLRQGKGSGQVALAEFQRLAKDSKNADETTTTGAAARDLCVKQGFFDNYDFCTELADASRAPFALECLQKEFRRQGGQPAGALYPLDTSKGNPLQAELDAVNADLKYLRGIGLGPESGNVTFDDRFARQKTLSSQINAGNTFNYWNTNFNTWGEVKTAIAALMAKTKSDNLSTQSLALKQSLGIQRESPALMQIDPKNGFELFFFPYPGHGNDDKLTFLGRRVLGGEDFPQIPDWSTGPKFNTGFNQMHFAIVTNLRPKQDETNISFQVSTDDGTALSVNTDIDPIRKSVSEPNYFSRFFAQAPSLQTNNNICTQLAANGPNYLTLRYYDGGGASAFRLQFRNCTSGETKTIPSYMFTLTQEPAAPYASFEVMRRDDALFFEELRLGRGLFAATTSGNGNARVADGASLPGGLIPYKLAAGARWEIKSRIAFQSLRTITILWGMDSPPATVGNVFYWLDKASGNGLLLYVEGMRLKARWSLAGQVLEGVAPVPLAGNGPFYTRITFEAVNVTLPNNIRIATVQMNVNDITRLDNDTNQIIISPKTNILFSRYIQDNNMAGFMGLGAAPGSQTNNIALQVGFLHIFDYVVDSIKSQVDATGQWKRKFIYAPANN